MTSVRFAVHRFHTSALAFLGLAGYRLRIGSLYNLLSTPLYHGDGASEDKSSHVSKMMDLLPFQPPTRERTDTLQALGVSASLMCIHLSPKQPLDQQRNLLCRLQVPNHEPECFQILSATKL